ncbi:unnamed protein product [Sphagnum balticum]
MDMGREKRAGVACLLAGPRAKFVWKTRNCLSWCKRSGKPEENFRKRRDNRLLSSCKFYSVPKYLKGMD